MSSVGIPDLLQSFVNRIEALEGQRASLGQDVKDIYAEAKSEGFDTKALRKVIALRKLDAEDRQRGEMILASYMAALGMLGDTPLGRAAVELEFGMQAHA